MDGVWLSRVGQERFDLDLQCNLYRTNGSSMCLSQVRRQQPGARAALFATAKQTHTNWTRDKGFWADEMSSVFVVSGSTTLKVWL